MKSPWLNLLLVTANLELVLLLERSPLRLNCTSTYLLTKALVLLPIPVIPQEELFLVVMVILCAQEVLEMTIVLLL